MLRRLMGAGMMPHGDAVMQGLVRGSTPNRAKRGLYHGKQILTGNQVSFSMRKTKRRFLPNVFTKRFHSDLLNRTFRISITMKALRCIDRAGGLDNYLLYTPPRRLQDSEFGQKLRDVLKLEYEKKTGEKFNRRALLFQQRKEALQRIEAAQQAAQEALS